MKGIDQINVKNNDYFLSLFLPSLHAFESDYFLKVYLIMQVYAEKEYIHRV